MSQGSCADQSFAEHGLLAHLKGDSIMQRAHTALAVDAEQEERGSRTMTDPTAGLAALAHANQDDVPLGLVDSDTSERSTTRV